jgi:hypothetical protein
MITSTLTATVTNLALSVSVTLDITGTERESTLINGNIQTLFTGRNLFFIADWGGIFLVNGEVTKVFDYAIGADVYERPADAQMINVCELID